MKERTPVICDRCRREGYLGESHFRALKPVLDFAPVPRRNARHDGWTDERQRGFIEALARTGSVTQAAAAVNMAKEGAYQLRLHPEAAEFRAAWETALDYGTRVLADAALDRAINGVAVPIMHGGQQVGERRVFNERLTMWHLQHRMAGNGGGAGNTSGTRHPDTLAREAEQAAQSTIDYDEIDLIGERLAAMVYFVHRCGRAEARARLSGDEGVANDYNFFVGHIFRMLRNQPTIEDIENELGICGAMVSGLPGWEAEQLDCSDPHLLAAAHAAGKSKWPAKSEDDSDGTGASARKKPKTADD